MKKSIVSAFLCIALAAFLCLPAAAEDATDLIDILCIGESLTCGSGANEAGTITEPKKDSEGNVVTDENGEVVMVSSAINGAMTYPARLYGKLGYGYLVHNMGISGIAVLPEPTWAYASEGYLKACQLTGMTKYGQNPFAENAPTADVVFIMLGTNDAKPRVWNAEKGTGGAENFYKYYTEIIEALRGLATDPQIVCVIPPPVVNAEGLNDYTIEEEILRDEITPLIRKVAREQHCNVVDLREVFPDPVTETEELLALYAVDDGVHPNKDGYNLIAEACLPYAKRIVGDVNASGAVNLSDLTELASYMAGHSTAVCDTLNSDVDVDGTIGVSDLTLIAKSLAGWDVKLY